MFSIQFGPIYIQWYLFSFFFLINRSLQPAAHRHVISLSDSETIVTWKLFVFRPQNNVDTSQFFAYLVSIMRCVLGQRRKIYQKHISGKVKIKLLPASYHCIYASARQSNF